MADEGKACRVIVPDDQLSLAIGKEGQNARLAARLTGYKIDIKPESYRVSPMRRSWTRNPSSDAVEFLSLRRGCGYRSAVPAAQQNETEGDKPGAVRRAV